MVRVRVLPVLGENITDGGAPTGPSPGAAAAATSSVPFGNGTGNSGSGGGGAGGGKGGDLIVGAPVVLWLKKQTLLQHAIQPGRWPPWTLFLIYTPGPDPDPDIFYYIPSNTSIVLLYPTKPLSH